MILVEPATLMDLKDLAPVLQERIFQGLVVQMSRSVAVSLRDEDDNLLAITGVYPMGDHGEAWVFLAAGLRHGRHRGPVIRKLVELVKGMRRVAVVVKADNFEGMKFAKLAGFVRDGDLFDGAYVRLMLNP